MKEALKTAIECLKIFKDNSNGDPMYTHAIKVLEALAQSAQQEPVAVVKTLGGYPDESRHEAKWLVPYRALKDGDNLYTTPPQRTWVGLTEARAKEIWLKGKDHGDDWLDVLALARAFEAELKVLNT